MTKVDPTALRCPECGGTISAPLDGGRRLCINCRHEWNPTDPPRLRAVPPPAAADGTPSPTAEHAHPPAVPAVGAPTTDEGAPEAAEAAVAPEDGQAALEALVGTQVVLEGGQLATLVGFPDDDHAEVVIDAAGEGERIELVSLNDVVRSVGAPPPVADVPDETAEALGRVNLTVAGLVLKAGISTIAGEAPNLELLTPPTGWLPLDADGLPALEQGCAYAIALLVIAFGIDREYVAAKADELLAVSQETNEPTKGGTDDDDQHAGDQHAGDDEQRTDANPDYAGGADDVHRGGDRADS